MSETNLFARVKDAKFCFPLGGEFWLQLLIICHDKTTIRPLEKKLLAESDELQKIKVLTENGIPEQGIRSTEYRLTTDRKSLGKAVKNVLAENRTLWDEVVVFGEKGWEIYTHSIKSLDVSKSTTQHAVQPIKPLKVGDLAYVVYPGPKGKILISNKAKITGKLKNKWRMDFGKTGSFTYPRNEVYKYKKEAHLAIKYWYTTR